MVGPSAALTQGPAHQEIADTAHFRDLDGVRGILAITVMLYHFGINVILQRLSVGLIGHAPFGAMVDFFFLLSGFVLTRAYLRHVRSIGRIAIERVFRLMPVHLVLMLLFAPVYIATTDRSALAIFTDWTATSVYFGLPRWNGPSWSINIELYLSIVLAAVVMLRRTLPTALAWAGLSAVMVAECVLAWQLALGAENFVVRGAVGLAGGSLLYRCTRSIAAPDWGRAWLLPAMTIMALAIVTASGIFAPIAVIGPPVLALAIWVGTGAHSILGRGIFALLGALSYPIYMVHMNLKELFYFATGVASFDGAIGIKLALIAAVFPSAWLLHRYIEIPGMAWGKRISLGMAEAERVIAPMT